MGESKESNFRACKELVIPPEVDAFLDLLARNAALEPTRVFAPRSYPY